MANFKAYPLSLCWKEYIEHWSLKYNNIDFKPVKPITVTIDEIKQMQFYTLWNEKNKNFSAAKRVFHKELYNNRVLPKETFYTRIEYSDDKEISVENYEKLKHFLFKYLIRWLNVEVEHVLSARAVWESFSEKDWHEDCIDSKWNPYAWRKCLEKIVNIYNLMISDLKILVPMLWHMNAIRSDYSAGIIDWELRHFWDNNNFEVDKDIEKFEPPEERRWDVARMKLYMKMVYPKYISFDDDYKEVLLDWSKIDPISPEEGERYAAILMLQKSINPILHEFCMDKYTEFFINGYFDKNEEEREGIMDDYNREYKKLEETNKKKYKDLFEKHNHWNSITKKD